MSLFNEKLAWIKTMQNRIDNPSMKSNTMPYPHACPTKQFKPKLVKKPTKLVPLQKVPPLLTNKQTRTNSDTKNLKDTVDNNFKEVDIPQPEEWEFDDERDEDIWEMMSGFEHKLVTQKNKMSELEKMEMEHKKLVNMAERIKKK